MKGASTADSRKRVRWMGQTSKSRQKEIARQAAGSPEQNQAINQDVKDRFLERAKHTHRSKHQWRGSQCKICGAFRRNHPSDSDCFVQNPIYDDAEAMKAVRYLASKYTADQIIDQWWRMERGK